MPNGTEHKPNFQPDRFTAEWWREQYEGVCHSLNHLSRETRDMYSRIEAMWKRFDEQELVIKEITAKLGQLTERIDKAAGVVKSLRATGTKPAEDKAKGG